MITKKQRGFIHIILPIILALIVFAGIGFYAYKKRQIRPTPTPSSTPTVDVTANWKTYVNKNFREPFEDREFEILSERKINLYT